MEVGNTMLHAATNMREICYCGHSGDVEDCDLVWAEASVRRLSVRSVVISTTPAPVSMPTLVGSS
jgi:hypothetical protein